MTDQSNGKIMRLRRVKKTNRVWQWFSFLAKRMRHAGQPLHRRNCPVWWSTYQEGLIVATTDLFSTQVELESYQIASSLREYTATSLAVCPCVSRTSRDSLKLKLASLFSARYPGLFLVSRWLDFEMNFANSFRSAIPSNPFPRSLRVHQWEIGLWSWFIPNVFDLTSRFFRKGLREHLGRLNSACVCSSG